MKKVKKKIIFILLAVIIASMYNPIIAMANGENIIRPYASDYIVSTEVQLTPIENGQLEILAGVKATKRLTKIGFVYIELHKYENGRWTIVDILVSDAYKSNVTMAYYSSTYRGEIGEIYRVLVKFYAGDNTGYDTRLVFSDAVSAKR